MRLGIIVSPQINYYTTTSYHAAVRIENRTDRQLLGIRGDKQIVIGDDARYKCAHWQKDFCDKAAETPVLIAYCCLGEFLYHHLHMHSFQS